MVASFDGGEAGDPESIIDMSQIALGREYKLSAHNCIAGCIEVIRLAMDFGRLDQRSVEGGDESLAAHREETETLCEVKTRK